MRLWIIDGVVQLLTPHGFSGGKWAAERWVHGLDY